MNFKMVSQRKIIKKTLHLTSEKYYLFKYKLFFYVFILNEAKNQNLLMLINQFTISGLNK